MEPLLEREQLPPGYALRAPEMGEIEHVLDLITVCDIAEFGLPDYSLEELRTEWTKPGIDLSRDAWILSAADGQLVGYAYVAHAHHARMFGMGCVHPEHTGRGLGRRLVGLMEARAREHVPLAPPAARVVLHIGGSGTYEPFRRLMEHMGYVSIRNFWRMEIALEEVPPAPKWPDGIGLRPFVRGRDERPLFDAYEEAFADHWGFLPHTFEDFAQRTYEREDFDPRLQFLAMDGGEIAGIACCGYNREAGWVHQLAVRRPWRRRGLGLALLLHVFGEFFRRGTRTIALGVDAQNLTGATRLYEQAGMRPAATYAAFEKELRAGVELATQSLSGDAGM